MQEESVHYKELIHKLKAERQKTIWEISKLDIQINDYIEKIGRGYILNSL